MNKTWQKQVIGVDISDRALRGVVMDEGKTVLRYQEVLLPNGVVTGGEIVDRDAFIAQARTLAQTLEKKDESNATVLTRLRSPLVVVSLPGAKIWSHSITATNPITPAELTATVQKAAEKIIPVDQNNLYSTCYHSSLATRSYATYFGAEQKVIDTYQACLTEAGFNVWTISNNFHAIARAVLPKTFDSDVYLIVNIGEERTTLGVFNQHAIAYLALQSLYGREEFCSPHTKKQSKKEIDSVITCEIALKEDTGTQEFSVVEQLQNDIKEISTHLAQSVGIKINKILLTGQRIELSSLATTLKKGLEIPVTIGDPYQHISSEEVFPDSAPPTTYANLIGLALYGVDHTFPHIDLMPQTKSRRFDSLLTHLRTFNSRVYQSFLDMKKKFTASPRSFLLEHKHNLMVILLFSFALVSLIGAAIYAF